MAGTEKSLIGTVVSDSMDKTVVVLVERTTRHPLYRKTLRRSKRFLAHDDHLDAKPGDVVRIMETSPISRHKRWRVGEIMKRGEVAEIAPREIDVEYLGQPRERAEEAAEEEITAEAPAEEPVAEAAEGPVAEEPTEEPAAEAPSEEPAAEAPEEEPVAEAPEEEPAAEEPAEQPVAEGPAEEPVAEEDAPSEEPAADEERQEP